jgi:hypothetical protein
VTTAAFVASLEGTVDGLVDGNIAYIIILHTFPIYSLIALCSIDVLCDFAVLQVFK